MKTLALSFSVINRVAWPMILVALNARTGEQAVFDRAAGVDLVDAVTAGTALPSMIPMHAINGVRYINGGMSSGENAGFGANFWHQRNERLRSMNPLMLRERHSRFLVQFSV